jgi:hypothetical protein
VSELRERAQERFAGLRRRGAAGPPPVTAVPAGVCVSAIARLAANDRAAGHAVLDVQKRLAARFADLHLYPEQSLHVTLLGLTPRREPPDWSADELAALVDLARAGCAPMGPVEARLGRLNLIGGQWFVEVLTDDPAWSVTRARLAGLVRAAGGEPITYADTEPMHVNVARVTGRTGPCPVADILRDPDLTVDRDLRLDTVEVVVTDFVVAPDARRVLDTIEWGREPG